MKHLNRSNPMSADEWSALPVTFDAAIMSRVCGCCLRYVQDHATELGGRKVAGRWLFSKPVVAELLGLTL